MPKSFLGIALALLWAVPIAGLEVVIATQAQWWKLPYMSMAGWMLVAAFFTVPFAYWTIRGRSWALTLSSFLAAAWTVGSGILAVRLRLPALGYFSIFLGGFFLLVLLKLRRETRRSFFDPELHWYQGLPKSVPGLSCQLIAGANRLPFQVSRIDREGAFLFSRKKADLPESKKLFRDEAAELVFAFRDREFRCHGLPVRILNRGVGAGFQFYNLSPDTRKDLGDFIENLRGEGYVE